MAVNTIYQPLKLAGNGIATAFQFTWKILQQTDLVVSKLDASGNPSGTLVLNVDYTVQFDTNAENGTVTFAVAPVTGGYANISRNSNQTQGTRYPRDNSLPAQTTEVALDKLTMLVQELLASVANISTGGQGGGGIGIAFGLFAARPASYAALTLYCATDQSAAFLWVPQLNAWLPLG